MTESAGGPDRQDPPEGPRGGLGAFLAENLWPAVWAGGATVAVEMGVFVAALAWGTPRPSAMLATVAVCVLWTALAAGVLAAYGRTALAAIVRGGIVADASLISLLVLWILCEQVPFVAAIEIYCVLVAVALAAVSATRLAKSPAGRCAWAVIASAVLVAILAGPFWIGGPVHGQPRHTAESIVTVAVYANPFYAATAALTETTRFAWHQASVMYRITRIGDYVAAPPLRWYPAVIIYLAAAVVLSGISAIVGRVRNAFAA